LWFGEMMVAQLKNTGAKGVGTKVRVDKNPHQIGGTRTITRYGSQQSLGFWIDRALPPHRIIGRASCRRACLAPPNRGSLSRLHVNGTHVPVEEPSTASKGDELHRSKPARLFDHLIRQREHFVGNGQPERGRCDKPASKMIAKRRRPVCCARALSGHVEEAAIP
jgi:hypothetical protein